MTVTGHSSPGLCPSAFCLMLAPSVVITHHSSPGQGLLGGKQGPRKFESDPEASRGL